MIVNSKISSVPIFVGMATGAAEVGGRVRELREQRGLSQAQLATRAAMHRSHIQRIENGAFGFPRPGTLRKLAEALNCDVDEITGKAPKRRETIYDANVVYQDLLDRIDAVDPEDREEIVRTALWMAGRARPRIPSSNLVLFPVPDDASGDFPFPQIIGPWIEKDTDTPRALHAWIVPVDAEAAAGVPRHEDDWLIPTTQLLNSVREVRDDRTKVVKVFGDSMHPTLRSGWKVLLDPARELFRPGKIVVVYIADEGTTMGVLAQSGERYWIQKRNPDYGGPMQIPLHAGAWYPVGTVTTIVEAPVEVE